MMDTPTQTHKRLGRPVWRRLVGWMVLLFAVLVLLTGGLLAALGTEAGTRWAVEHGVALSADAGSPAQVAVGAVSGSLLGRLELRDVSLSDDSGAWLTIDRFALEWRPWRLLQGRVWIDDLSAGTVAVMRGPEMPPAPQVVSQQASGGGFDPLLLERLTIRGINLQSIELHEGLIGPAAALSIRAQSMGTALGGVEAKSEIRRLDGETSLTTDIAYTAQRSLAVHAVLHDVQGGLLGTLSGLEGAPAVNLTIDGDGPIEKWTAQLFGELAEVLTVDGDLSLALSDGMTVSSQGRLLPGPALASSLGEAAGLAIGSGINFSLKAAQDPQGTLRVDQLSASADAWAVQGALTLGADGALKGRADVGLSDGNLVTALSGVPLTDAAVGLEISGSLDSPRLAVDLRSSGSYVDHALLSLAVDPASGGALALDVTGKIDQWGSAAKDWSALIGPQVTLAVNGTLDSADSTFALSSLAVNTDAAGLSADANLSWKQGVRVSGTLRADMPTLSTLAPLTGLALAGAGQVTVEITDLFQPPDGPAQAEIALSFGVDDFALGIPQADSLLAGAVRGQGAIHLKDQTVNISDLSLTTPGVKVSGDLSAAGLDRSAPDLAGTITTVVPDLSRLDGRLQGGLRFPLQISGSPQTAQAAGTLVGEGLKLDGTPVETLSIPLSATASSVTIAAAQIKAAGAQVQSDLVLNLAPLGVSGAVALTVPQPASLEKLIGLRVGAGTSLTIRLDPAQGRQAASLEGQIASITMPGVSTGVIALKGRFDNLLAQPEGTASLRAAAIKAGEGAVHFDTLALDTRLLAKDGGLLEVTLNGEGALAQPVSLMAMARMPLGGGGVSVSLERLHLHNKQHSVALTQPLRITQNAQGWRLEGLSIAADKGTVRGQASQQRGQLDIALKGENLSLALADLAVADLPVQGLVDLDASIKGQAGALSLVLRNVALPEADVKGLGAQFQAALDRKSLQAEGKITGFGNQPMLLAAHIPTRFGADGIPQVVGTQPASASAKWNGPVASLWALVPAVGHRLTGNVALDVRMDGTLDAPIMAGAVTLADGRYENLEWGTVLDRLTAKASLQPDGAVDVNAEGTDGADGGITAQVKMTPQPEQAPDIAAVLTVRMASLVRRDDLKVKLDGEIRYQGPADSGALTGALASKGVEVNLTDSLGGGVQTLPVVEINRSAANLPPKDQPEAESEQGAAKPITLDLSISLPGQVFVRGQGLDSEWKGKLHVGGTATKPLVTGNLSVARGGFAVVGKDFSLEKGVITFSGGERINPGLDIKAVHSTDDLVASIIVGGTAKKPSLSLESTPSLPSDEILSRVLFGSSVGKLSASQALSVAQAAAALSGQGGGGPGISDMLRSSLGLDVLSFGGGGDTGAGAVEVGKYVAEGVYVGVEQGLTPESSGVKVEVELTPRISVETKATGAAGADVGVNYKFNY